MKRWVFNFFVFSIMIVTLAGCADCKYTESTCRNNCGWGTGVCVKCSNGKFKCVKTDGPPSAKINKPDSKSLPRCTNSTLQDAPGPLS